MLGNSVRCLGACLRVFVFGVLAHALMHLPPPRRLFASTRVDTHRRVLTLVRGDPEKFAGMWGYASATALFDCVSA